MKRLLHPSRQPARDSEPIEPLPFLLPGQTQREAISAPSDAESLGYGLFSRLPYEVRRTILSHAFGERTLHVDLSHRHPLVRKSNRPVSGSQNKIVATHCGIGSELVEDTSQPKHWQWFSCVCHRLAEVEIPSTVAFYTFNSTLWPWEDGCLQGRLCYCDSRTATEMATGSCSVGAIGWLLSCKSAYADGVRVLYSTNNFYISSLPLLLNASRLLRKESLSMIRELQIAPGTHDLTRGAKDPLLDGLWDGSTGPPNGVLSELCCVIPTTFPNLRKLDIYLQSWLVLPRHVPAEEALGAMEREVLGPVHTMLRRFASTVQLSVAVSVEAWKALAQKYHQLDPVGLKYEQYHYDSGRFWVSLSPDSTQGQFGYWMYAGWNDTDWVHNPFIQSCFGGGSHVNDVWGYYKRQDELGPVPFPR